MKVALALLALAALAVWGGAIQRWQDYRAYASQLEAEQARKAAEAARRRQWLASSVIASEQLRALLVEARAAAETKSWQRIAAMSEQARALELPFRQAGLIDMLDRETLREWKQLTARQQQAQLQQANLELADHVAKAALAVKDKRWTDLEAELAAASTLRAAHAELDPELLRQLAAASAVHDAHLAEEAPRREALKQYERLGTALDHAEHLARAERWSEASLVFQALLEAIASLPAEVKAQLPASFSLRRFERQVQRRAAQVGARARR